MTTTYIAKRYETIGSIGLYLHGYKVCNAAGQTVLLVTVREESGKFSVISSGNQPSIGLALVEGLRLQLSIELVRFEA